MKFQNTLIVGVMLLIGAVAVGERVYDTVWPEPIEDRSPRFEGGQPAEPVVPSDATVRIDMVPDAFEPEHVTVQKGQKVCWVNNDTDGRWPASNVHPTHEVYSAFDPKGPVRPGETWCFTFDKVGSWVFHDHLLPELTGSVLVQE